MIQEEELLTRITVRPDVFGGKPIIRDMRIAVEHVLANLAAGETTEGILENYPFLELGACAVEIRESENSISPRPWLID